MIEVIAEILRGPVFLAGETLHCRITLTNKLSDENDSTNNQETSEKISWASVQLHCQRYVNEQKVNLQQQQLSSAKSNDSLATNVDIVPLDSTALIATKGETGQTVYTSKPCVLFCDLTLQPGETRIFSYSETISTHVPPTFRGSYVKYSYKLTIGTQRVNHPTTLIRVPFRVLVVPGTDLDKFIRQDKAAIASSQTGITVDNPFVSPNRTEIDSLTTALDALQILTSRAHQHVYNITNNRGRVCRFTLFKNNFKLGEDITGIIDFDHTDVSCLQYTVTLQSEEILNQHYRRKSSQFPNLTSFTKQSEFCLSTSQTYLSLSIPLSCTPTFSVDLVSLRWKLHFEFVISKTPRSLLSTNNDPSTSTIWLPSSSIDVESMTWDLGIKILPTNPCFANNVAKVSCTTVATI
ncbi:unnamed protein product [Rotaria sordida]|uniref:RAB6A-GEF complex partner protein 2 n=1 Tax=Rotaria sordida TaxID=392033 RepID=A0A819C6K7_9BILA|nr:unnamed protein product [Rotaria sordida]CAF3923453.1 unnamed protein product [Rotaria sordida]